MEENDKLVFEVKLELKEKIQIAASLLIGIVFFLYYFYMYINNDLTPYVPFIFFFLLWIILTLRSSITFVLYSDKLIVRRPLFFPNKTAVKFQLSDLKEVVFNRAKLPFRNEHFIVKTRKYNTSFRTNMSDTTCHDFIAILDKLGVKASVYPPEKK